MTTTASAARVIPLDMPIDLHESKVMYRNGRARMVVTRIWGDDYRPWDDDEGQVPFWVPETDSTIESIANEAYLPGGLDHALYELGSLELVARWLRIFHDNVRVAEVSTIVTGYVQGDFSKVLTVVTDEWLKVTGRTPFTDMIEREVSHNIHLKAFAAWAAGNCYDLRLEALSPLSECESDCDWTDEQCCIEGDWVLIDSYIDLMDGPLHSECDVDYWLNEGVLLTDMESEWAAKQRHSTLNAGHYSI